VIHDEGSYELRFWQKKEPVLLKKKLRRFIWKSEYRIMNIEGRRNVFSLFYKKIEHNDSTLRNSAVRYSIFDIRYSALRCLIQVIEAGSLIIKKTVPFW